MTSLSLMVQVVKSFLELIYVYTVWFKTKTVNSCVTMKNLNQWPKSIGIQTAMSIECTDQSYYFQKYQYMLQSTKKHFNSFKSGKKTKSMDFQRLVLQCIKPAMPLVWLVAFEQFERHQSSTAKKNDIAYPNRCIINIELSSHSISNGFRLFV